MKQNSRGVVLLIPLIILASAAFFVVMFLVLDNEPETGSTPQESTTTPDSTLTPTNTSNWKIYTNARLGHSFERPSESGVKELQRESSSAIAAYTITNENSSDVFNDKSENEINDYYFSLTIEVWKNTSDEKIISDHFDMTCNSPWRTDPSVCKQEKVNAFENYNQNEITGTTANITPYERSFTYLIIHQDSYTLFTSLGGYEGIFPSENAINLRDQILSTFKFIDIEEDLSCTTDNDCGVNMCNCKAMNKNFIEPSDKICQLACNKTPICYQGRCIFKGEENIFNIQK